MTEQRSHTDTRAGAAFEKFLKAPWPLPDPLMTERKRLWCAFEAGAQWAINAVREGMAHKSDEDVTPAKPRVRTIVCPVCRTGHDLPLCPEAK